MAQRFIGSHAPVVVVTGASAGLGRAVAERFARSGWRVGLIARHEGRLEETAAACRALGSPRAAVLPLDVADADALDAAADVAERDLGPIDVWINSAMATVFSPFRQMTAGEFRRITEVTYLGQVYGTMAALRRMRARERGCILLMGSALAYRGLPLQSAYSGAKFGVRGFFEALRAELMAEGSGIHLGMVQLPAMNTPQFEWVRSRLPRKPQPVPPIFQPEPCADAVYRAALHRKREVWVGMSSLKLIAGSMVAPGAYIDHMMTEVGIDGQQGPEPADPDRPDNLFDPAPGPSRVHGRFGDSARRRVWDIEADTLREAFALAATGGLAVLGGLLLARRSRR